MRTNSCASIDKKQEAGLCPARYAVTMEKVRPHDHGRSETARTCYFLMETIPL